jgi:hypothetical protein
MSRDVEIAAFFLLDGFLQLGKHGGIMMNEL